MYISDVVLEQDNLNLVNRRIKFATFYMVMFAIGLLAAIALVVYSAVTQVADFYTYLFNGTTALIAVFWIIIAYRQQYMFKAAKIGIESSGTYTIVGTTIQVDAKHKFNTYTILNLVCAILVFACFVGTIVVQVLNFEPSTLYSIALSFVLTVFLAYQTTIGFIDDKMYRKVVFNNDESVNESEPANQE